MTGKKISLDQILSMTRQLHKLVSTGEWEEADKLENIRHSAIQACFASDEATKDVVVATMCIKEIQQLDKEIIEISAKARREIGAELNKIQQGRAAISAYRSAE